MKTLAKMKLFWVKLGKGEGEGVQIPCKLHFTEDTKYIDKLKCIDRYIDNKYIDKLRYIDR